MGKLNPEKEVATIFVSGQSGSSALIIPKEMAQRKGLIGKQKVILEEREDEIAIKRLVIP